MIERRSWIKRIEEVWEETPIVWLSGVKGVGKTTLIQGLGTQRTLYVDCDPARSAHIAADPEFFFRACDRPVVVFDDVHKLPDAMKILKTGADLSGPGSFNLVHRGGRQEGGDVLEGSAACTLALFLNGSRLQRFAGETVLPWRAP